MTDVSAIVTQLDASKTLITQVLTPVPGGFDLPAATAQEIESVLDSVFSDELYPVLLPESANHPSMVYTLTGIDTFEVDGYRVTQTDSYTLTLRTTVGVTSRYAQFDDKLRSTITALRASAYSIEPVDVRVAYDDAMAVIVGEIDIECTYVVEPGGGTPGNNAAELPCALVVPVGRSAEDSEYDNLIKQRVTDMYGVVLITADGNMPALISEVQGALLGFGQTVNHFDMEYVSGQNLGGVADMAVWREIYKDSVMITEA